MIANIRHNFTLVELLVAMVVLVVMMGFLFQFTIGAQRIWTATTSEDDAFQNAQILMQVLGDDLENAMFSLSDTNPDDYIPFYIKKNGGKCEKMCFLTSGRGCDTPSFVIYDYDSDTLVLHRTVIKYRIDISGEDSIYPMGLVGNKDEGTIQKMLDNSDDIPNENKNIRETVCERLSSFDVLVAADVSSNFINSEPKAFQLNFTIEQQAPNGSVDEKYRCFSKTIFYTKSN